MVLLTYLHNKQAQDSNKKKANEVTERYRSILGGGTLLPSGSQGCVECVDPASPNLART